LKRWNAFDGNSASAWPFLKQKREERREKKSRQLKVLFYFLILQESHSAHALRLQDSAHPELVIEKKTVQSHSSFFEMSDEHNINQQLAVIAKILSKALIITNERARNDPLCLHSSPSRQQPPLHVLTNGHVSLNSGRNDSDDDNASEDSDDTGDITDKCDGDDDRSDDDRIDDNDDEDCDDDDDRSNDDVDDHSDDHSDDDVDDDCDDSEFDEEHDEEYDEESGDEFDNDESDNEFNNGSDDECEDEYDDQ
jgi:hypothetical protein